MNVIVFALDSCPVSALGPYGNEWIGTPNLDRLAAEGVVFDRHISDCPDPHAARRAWRTARAAGLNPAARGDLLQSLTSRGVQTVLVRHTRAVNDSLPEFVNGWPQVIDVRPEPADLLAHALPAVLDGLSGNWLLWVELDRLTPPWHIPTDVFAAYVEDEDEPDEAAEPPLPWADPPTGWFDRDDFASWELLHRSFAAALTAFDADLGHVFDVLRSRGFDQTATWVFTAARGYPLGEHGIIGPHRPWLHEELVHVPLIVRLPNAAEAGRRTFALTQPADLPATILGWLGGEPLAGDGIDLAPLIDGRAESIRPHAVSKLEIGSAAEWAIRTPGHALLLPIRTNPDDDPRPVLLYEKPDDAYEVNDLHSREPETAGELEHILRAAVTPP